MLSNKKKQAFQREDVPHYGDMKIDESKGILIQLKKNTD
jgi:hypothetical protein